MMCRISTEIPKEAFNVLCTSSHGTSCCLSMYVSLIASFQPPPIGVHLVHRVHGDEGLDTAHMNAKWFEFMNSMLLFIVCFGYCCERAHLWEVHFNPFSCYHATPIAVWEEGGLIGCVFNAFSLLLPFLPPSFTFLPLFLTSFSLSLSPSSSFPSSPSSLPPSLPSFPLLPSPPFSPSPPPSTDYQS